MPRSMRIGNPEHLLEQLLNNPKVPNCLVHSKTYWDCPGCMARLARFALYDLITLRETA